MDISNKILKLLDLIFVTFKVTTRDLYIIPCANIKEFLVLAIMITAISLTAHILNMPVFLDYRGCIVGVIILLTVHIFSTSNNDTRDSLH